MVLSHKQVLRWVKFACEKCDVPELFNDIKIRYSKKMTATVGIAYIYNNEIALSIPFMEHPKYTKDECIDTIVHETCHIIAYYLYGEKEVGHGELWKELMNRCGFEPETCYHGKAHIRKKK